MIDKQLLIDSASAIDVEISSQQAEQFSQYADLLVDWNSKVNLTAITEPTEIVHKHFIDSLYLLGHISDGQSLVDVGTGAGFPSIPCLIANPTIQLTMVESLGKRVRFLETVIETLQLQADSITGRAEEVANNPQCREQFDVATARAVANLSILCELCMPYVKVGGKFVALKGPSGNDELKSARQGIKLLGGEVSDIINYSSDTLGDRTIVVVQKISQTSTKYPRMYGKIKKSPL